MGFFNCKSFIDTNTIQLENVKDLLPKSVMVLGLRAIPTLTETSSGRKLISYEKLKDNVDSYYYPWQLKVCGLNVAFVRCLNEKKSFKHIYRLLSVLNCVENSNKITAYILKENTFRRKLLFTSV